MRVVMIAHAFPRWPGDVAGSFLLRLAEALAARGHTVAVVAPADRGRASRLTFGAVSVLQVRYAAPEREDLAYTGDMNRSARSPAGAWAFLRLVRALRHGAEAEAGRIGAQLLHAFWWIPGGWAAAGARLPAVVSLMGTDVAMMQSGIGRILARRVLSRATRVTALSSFLAAQARQRTGLAGLAIDRVPVPADVERFRASGDGGPRQGIIYLGRLTRQKRVDLLLDAVHASGLAVPVTIVGDGPARGELEERATSLGLTSVRFLGTLPDEAIPRLLRGAAVAAFLSQNEGLGLAAAEAQMMGTPVVATTDGGGVLDLVRDGEGALLVPPEPGAVRAALRRCLTDPTMQPLAARAGDRLRADLSPDGVAAQFEQVYARVA